MAIYFIKNPITDTVKIGWSTTIPTKLQRLSEASGINLVLLGVLYDDKERLAQLRVEFDASNYMGDWYNITIKLEEFLKDLSELHKKDQMVRVRWEIYQLLVEHKQKTYIPITKINELAILAYFESDLPAKGPTIYPPYYGGPDDE